VSKVRELCLRCINEVEHKSRENNIPATGAGIGLPALEPDGVFFAPVPTSLIFFFLTAPSDISPPVASPSLIDPAPTFDRCVPKPGGRGVVDLLSWTDADAFFIFLRVDSLPLDSERFGEPGRLSDLPFFRASVCFCLPDGVVAPLDEVPDATLSFGSCLIFVLFSSSFLASSCFSSSEFSSLYTIS
jgi:hypothetical protein